MLFLLARTHVSGLKSFSPLSWEMKQSKLQAATAGQPVAQRCWEWHRRWHCRAVQSSQACLCLYLCAWDAVDMWCCEVDVLCSLTACLEMHLLWGQPWFGVWDESFGECQVCTRAGKGIKYLMVFFFFFSFDDLELSGTSLWCAWVVREISIRNQWGLFRVLFCLMNVFIVDLGLSTLMNFSESPQIWRFSGKVRD